MSNDQSPATVQNITELPASESTEPRVRWYQDRRTWKITGAAATATAMVLLVKKALSSDDEDGGSDESTEYVFEADSTDLS